MDNQQGPTTEPREFCSMLCGSLDGRGVWGRMDTCYVWLSPFAFFFFPERFPGNQERARVPGVRLVLPEQWAFHSAFSSGLPLPTKHLNLTPEMPCASIPHDACASLSMLPDEPGLTALIPPEKSANIPGTVPQPATQPQQVILTNPRPAFTDSQVPGGDRHCLPASGAF